MRKINFKNNFVISIIRDLFLVAFVLFIVFSFLEVLKPRIVLNYLNLDIYLFLLILLGVITIFLYQPEAKESNRLKFLDYSAIILFSILIGVLILYLTRQVGLLSILIGVISAVVCYLFIILNMRSKI